MCLFRAFYFVWYGAIEASNFCKYYQIVVDFAIAYIWSASDMFLTRSVLKRRVWFTYFFMIGVHWIPTPIAKIPHCRLLWRRTRHLWRCLITCNQRLAIGTGCPSHTDGTSREPVPTSYRVTKRNGSQLRTRVISQSCFWNGGIFGSIYVGPLSEPPHKVGGIGFFCFIQERFLGNVYI